MAEKLNVGIVGSGYAGMAAAVTLAEHGIPVTVYESAKQLGGRARGLDYNGTRLDNGQHVLLGCYRHTLELIEQVGGSPADDFLRLPLQLTIHNRFELKAPALPAPLHTLAGLLTARGLPFSQRLAAARFMQTMRRIKFALPQDMNALQLLHCHHQDNELIRLLWEPVCISALNTPLEQASAQVLLNVLRDSLNGTRTDSDILLPRIDFSSLFPERAAEFIRRCGGQVINSCSVDAVLSQNKTIELHTAQGVQHHSHAICATAPTSAARLLRDIPQLAPVVAQIEALTFQPIYTVYLQYPPQVQLPQEMLGLDRCHSQWLFDKGRISGQHGLIACVISAQGRHQELTQDELAKTAAQELREQMGIAAQLLWHRVIAEKRATFSCEPGLSRPPAQTGIPELLLAGDYLAGDYPATLESAVMNGRYAALEICGNGQEPRVPTQ